MKTSVKILATVFLPVLLSINAFSQSRLTHREYIDTYKHLAMINQEVYGIPASITMAQGLLESDCGNSRLATEANNHFGIKCKRDWDGESILHDDDDIGECFRKYSSAEDSYKDHSEFLDKSPRYQDLFTLDATDYKGWAHGLKSAGYATNPQYAELLIKLIEDHELYLLDAQVEGLDYAANRPGEPITTIPVEPLRPAEGTSDTSEKIDIDNYVVAVRTLNGRPIYFNNGSEFILSREGDTFEKLSGISGVSVKKLRKFNDYPETAQPHASQPIYLRAKSNKATNGKLIHIVSEGETMHSISQAYGIKLKKLANLNRRSVDSRLSQGQQIRLM